MIIRKYIILISLFFCVSATSAENNLENGNDWNNLSLESKGGYIIGFCDAVLHQSNYNRHIALLNKQKNITNYPMIYVSDELLSGISMLQIVDGLDLFYRDFKNKHILVNDAIYIVCKTIKGCNKKDLECDLSFLRNGKKGIRLSDVLNQK